MEISASRLQQLREMIVAGASDDFYDWTEWIHVRSEALQLDRYECQLCRSRHRYRPAVIVHHVKHLRDRPDLALSLFDPETGDRQLISLCRACHEEQHPDRRWRRKISVLPLTTERWD